MMSSLLNSLCQHAGFTKEYIEAKVKEVGALAKKKNLLVGPHTSFFVCYDMNGPLTATHDAALYPYPGVADAMAALQNARIRKSLVSGWDIRSLTAFRDKRLKMSDLGIVGEHGTVWEQDGTIHEVSPIPKEEVLAMKMKVVREAAKENLKLAIQGNNSSRVTGIFFEADGPERGNVRSHILLEASRLSIEELFKEFAKDMGFRLSEERIIFTPNEATIQEFDRVLRTIFPLRSVRLSLRGEELSFWLDSDDRPDFDVQDMESFVLRTLSSPWKYLAHDDFGVDIMYQDDPGKQVTKESTAYLVAEQAFGRTPHVITNVGDRPSDVFTKEQSIFFAQKGTDAHQYCKENSVPHVAVEHGGDYSLILATLLGI